MDWRTVSRVTPLELAKCQRRREQIFKINYDVCFSFGKPYLHSSGSLVLHMDVRVSQCSEECSGQFLECLVHINSSIRYTDNDQLHTSCTEGELYKGPLCIQRVMDECEEAFDVAPDQMAELRDQQKAVQDKFQNMCAEFLKLHPSASSSTSGSRNQGVTWGSRGLLSAVLVVLVIPQWALSS